MIKLNKIESKYFDLLSDKITLKEFESWVYKTNWLENELTENEYIDLISLNYNTPNAKHELSRVLKERFDQGKFETVKMVELLKSIIERDGKEAAALIETYHLYCSGYYFLQDLGLDIGLTINAPYNYGAIWFHDLSEKQVKELVDSVYPLAKNLAVEIKGWLLKGDLKLTGEQDAELNRWQYNDYRTDVDKKVRGRALTFVLQRPLNIKTKTI